MAGHIVDSINGEIGKAPKFVLPGTLWPKPISWAVCLPVAVCGIYAALHAVLQRQYILAVVLAGICLVFASVFLRIFVSQTSFSDESWRRRSMLGRTREYSYGQIALLRKFRNGVMLVLDDERRLRILVGRNVRSEFFSYLQQRVSNELIHDSPRALYAFWEGPGKIAFDDGLPLSLKIQHDLRKHRHSASNIGISKQIDNRSRGVETE